MNINIVALTCLSMAILPGFKSRDHGAIVNLGSAVGFDGYPYTAIYGATKAYVQNLFRALQAEHAGANVVVQLVAPAATVSDLERALPEISQKMLIQQLRALEEDRVVSRTIYAQGLMGIESGRFASSVDFGLSSRIVEDAERLETGEERSSPPYKKGGFSLWKQISRAVAELAGMTE